MRVTELLSAATDGMTVRRVFGEPIESAGGLVIPVAWVAGGAGGGGGEDADGGSSGSGGGLGFRAGPVGVYQVRDGEVSWHPALNVNAIVLGGQVLAGVLLLAALGRLARS